MPRNAKLKVLGIEVVQSIQNLENKIPLIANKATVVRVYVTPLKLAVDMPVTGTLEIVRQGEVASEVGSKSSIELRTGNRHPKLQSQRRNLNQSFTFFLEEGQTEEGAVEFSLKRVTPTLRGDPEVVIQDEKLKVEFGPGPRLRVRAVGLRVRDPQTGKMHAPKPVHFNSLRSYLNRAFPVSNVEWEEITIDAAAGFEPPYSVGQVSFADPGPIWQERFTIACAQLMAIRARDVENDQEQGTHYYGLVYHPNDFFVGAVSDVPSTPHPDVVGVGPAEIEDGSYGAHELAHALGRLHPGFCGEQKKEDRNFPKDYQGKLSSPAEDHYGFDVGDDTQSPRVLPFDSWYDLMTYCNDVWVSAYTYEELLERLHDENRLRSTDSGGKYLLVIGTYNFGNGQSEGALRYVFPVGTESLAAGGDEPRVVVIGKAQNGDKIFEENVVLKRAVAIDLPRDSGAFQITVPHRKELSHLELQVDGTVVDKLSDTPMTVDAASKLANGSVQVLPPMASTDDPFVLTINWPNRADRDLWHTVQARTPGRTWQTIAVGITTATTELLLDRHQFLMTPSVEIRILGSSGFSEMVIYEGELPIES